MVFTNSIVNTLGARDFSCAVSGFGQVFPPRASKNGKLENMESRKFSESVFFFFFHFTDFFILRIFPKTLKSVFVFHSN